jgi:CHAT domain-containing protein
MPALIKTILSAYLLIVCSMTSTLIIAQPSKEDAEIENIKAPPRDIKDILKILEQTKQDQSQLEKAKAVLALPIPNSTDAEILNNFFYRRAYADGILGNSKDALDNMRKVVFDYPSRESNLRIDELVTLANFESQRGNRLAANNLLEKGKEYVSNQNRGRLITLERFIGTNCLRLGDIACAKNSVAKVQMALSNLSNARNIRQEYTLVWESNNEWARAQIFSFEGKFIEAERGLRKALKLNADILSIVKDSGKDAINNEVRVVQDASTSSKFMYMQRIAMMVEMSAAFLGQRRLIDAEYWSREAVLLGIKQFGIDSAYTTFSLLSLTRVISEQGRSSEALLLAKSTLNSAQKSTDFQGSTLIAESRRALGDSLVTEKKYEEAEKVFTDLVKGINTDPEIAALYQTADLNWALALIKMNKGAEAEVMMAPFLEKSQQRFEKTSPRLALIRAFNASALQSAGKTVQANAEFRNAIPILLDQAKNDTENSTESIRQSQRLNFVLEEYLDVLAAQYKVNPTEDIIKESFQMADLARGSGVQRALTASAARANITEPQLANLARKEQDLQQRINTLTELLTGLLSAPPAQQLPTAQAKIRADIVSFKSERDSIKKDIAKKFPEYAELVSPQPASIDRVQKMLKPEEVLISWYFADKVSYVWAIPKDAPPKFAQLNIGREQMAKNVSDLRKSLDPGVSTIDEIPAYDVVLAHKLYEQILAPVASTFQNKKIMLTVPHAELGQLPLSLLVTKPTIQPAKGGVVPFANYKSVPWLTREIAVSQLPSVTSLTSLRALPVGNANRKNFIGFGDPYFSAQQEKTAEKQFKTTQLATRGIPLNLRSAPKTSGVSSAELALLPRLPDTKNEIEDIAKVVGASNEDIYLNQKASVKQVMSTDLSNRKVVMFATHGLVPGELDGLTQPALALSSPEVTGDKDDGLLTMDKVLTLKLDADWVVLSACNTATGEGAGSEAVSGLGRAFFYAGARALLVSNWPVDSAASRNMMTDLFTRQQQSKDISKAELLRQAMLNQIDQGGMKEGNTLKYAYAHPLFWAPFIVVGD